MRTFWLLRKYIFSLCRSKLKTFQLEGKSSISKFVQFAPGAIEKTYITYISKLLAMFQSSFLLINISVLIFCCTFLLGLSETYQVDATYSETSHMKKVLKCLLLDKHERFNQNVTVTWLFKKTCKIGCWNQIEREEDWVEVDCGGPCKLSLALNDDIASRGLYLCKINPYQISETTSLNVEVTKTFRLDLIGKTFFTIFNSREFKLKYF